MAGGEAQPQPAPDAETWHLPYLRLGAHLQSQAGEQGARFAVWAPNARSMAVVGDFNGWQPHRMQRAGDGSGQWQAFVPGASAGQCYKFRVEGADGSFTDKADPLAFCAEEAPRTASRLCSLDYAWADGDWMAGRAARQALDAPMSIYEVHLGSWERNEDRTPLNYRELGRRLAAHCQAMGFTHVELMPVAEHPFYGSWGYQITGYYAPTARYGTPQDLMALVDTLHQHGIGVLLDWVPSHFPSDEHGLARFDGTHLYEHADPRQGFHPQWSSLVFNYGRSEVRDFLIGNALFWLDKYHFDGLRVDAVASMLYLDYARKPGQWKPNIHGGHENLEAVEFLRQLDTAVYRAFPDVHMIAEESTAWPGVSRPVHEGGLGFGLKWNMGWMNDTLRYVSRDSVHRKWHEGELRFSMHYAFNENFLLPLSHDEVVYGKGSLLSRQPGDDWQRFAGLRALYGYMWAHPGKKLLFMGGEFAQSREWHHERVLDWHLMAQELHGGVRRWVADLNRVYTATPALWQQDFSPAGFDWAALAQGEPTVLAFLRRARDPQAEGALLLAVCNFTPRPLTQWHVGVPVPGLWTEVLNSDAADYGGSGMGNLGGVQAQFVECGGQPFRLEITVPPLAVVWFTAPAPGAVDAAATVALAAEPEPEAPRHVRAVAEPAAPATESESLPVNHPSTTGHRSTSS
ncbi:MAG: 1,4-alpha-glucan branching protein GlgB [Burkholderiaceae bacterium]|nr:1,4-alpha-glucan branching protein GlgB [Burkholderiaceae bacterium]